VYARAQDIAQVTLERMSTRQCRVSDQRDRLLYGIDCTLRNDVFDDTRLFGR
jgi:hypothetical protein